MVSKLSPEWIGDAPPAAASSQQLAVLIPRWRTLTMEPGCVAGKLSGATHGELDNSLQHRKTQSNCTRNSEFMMVIGHHRWLTRWLIMVNDGNQQLIMRC